MEEFSCVCSKCQSACENKPGWFIPTQVDSILKYFKVHDLSALLGDKLAIDWYIKNENILVLSPQIVSNEGNIQFPGNPQGRCVFFKNRRCVIYEIRPFECRKLNHDIKKTTIDNRHQTVADMWERSAILNNYKDKIVFKSSWWG